MRIPHYGPGDQIPPPVLVAAWFKIGDLATERVPFWAAHWIADGMDGEALAILAGMDGSDPHEVRDLLPAALADTRTAVPHEISDAVTIVYRDLARLHLADKISARELIFKVAELIENAHPARDYLDQPLGAANGLDYEWTCDHCRTPEELTKIVHGACLAQVRQQQTPHPSG
ncbi:hypothetical protein EDD29_4505 [Actinocorallia herbida]|uniref:Uncharacterized protein n=1 Tax=Actinocorallia herbida TaxID=58109 RepID=A0A3N1D070_9ACTN|nr:hypothetical protein [Actinocorallia herbida]ROO86921.1 hypothetical protein EDD29_4505 [Actinocorallia herbida]